MRFSERCGHKKVHETLQIYSVDKRLRNRLWNVLKSHVWDHVSDPFNILRDRPVYLLSANPDLNSLCRALWDDHFGATLDQLSDSWTDVGEELRRHLAYCEWYELYDFIEFVADHYPRHDFREPFMKACNTVLKSELSAYRFVGGIVTPVTDPQEIDAIEAALEGAEDPVRDHLGRALELLADRDTPDYRNSIKESISAVESLVASTVGENGTLGQLLKKLEQQIGLHPALRKAFSNLYGYTSDEGGIRHALIDEETADFDHAKFMLVVCSAFVGFVLSKVD